MKLKFVALAGMAVIVVVLIVLNLQQSEIKGVEGISESHEEKKLDAAPKKPQETVKKLVAAKKAERETESVVPEPEPMPANLDAALESMQKSLAEGDERTPPMAKSTPREKPTEAQLADPQLYEQYEAQQSAKVASIYLSAIKEIPIIRNLIDNAKLSGSRSPEEIAEAEEALQKLEGLKVDFEQQHPELVEQMESNVGVLEQENTNVTDQPK